MDISGPLSAHDYIESILTRIAQDRFGQRNAPTLRLSADTRESGPGLSGAMEVFIHKGAGEEVLIHRESFAEVRTRDEVDDVFARTLSVVLMKHPSWPR